MLAYAYGNMHVGLHDIIQPRGSVSNPGRCQFYFVRLPNTVRTTLYYACDQTDTQVEVCSRRCSHESLFIERELSVTTLLLEIRACAEIFLLFLPTLFVARTNVNVVLYSTKFRLEKVRKWRAMSMVNIEWNTSV